MATSNAIASSESSSVASAAKVDMKFELVVIPVSDVDRAKGPDEPYLSGRKRVSGPDAAHVSYRSFASFSDPDGNGWFLQEVTTRAPGRIDSTTTNFGLVSGLASAMRRAAAAHGEHEKRTGQHDANWPDWYAKYMVHEQNGEELPQ